MLKNKHAFTLIELLVTVSIVGILASIAAPSWTHLLKTYRSHQLYNNFFQLLLYTRSTAVSVRSDVILCSSEDEQVCDSDWEYPLIIFIDRNKNNERDNDEPLERATNLLKKNEKILWRSFGRKPYIRFTSDGSTVYQSGNVSLCLDSTGVDNEYRSQIKLSNSGRARKAKEDEIKDNACD